MCNNPFVATKALGEKQKPGEKAKALTEINPLIFHIAHKRGVNTYCPVHAEGLATGDWQKASGCKAPLALSETNLPN